MVGKEKITTAEAFGRALRTRRKEAQLTQEELGFEANLRRTYISILELGQQQPSLETILSLAKALDVSPGVLVDEVAQILSGNRGKRETRRLTR